MIPPCKNGGGEQQEGEKYGERTLFSQGTPWFSLSDYRMPQNALFLVVLF